MKEYYCANCGKHGHLYKNCLFPIISLGVVLYRKKGNKLEYLMVQRKDTLGYVEFMRGKYNEENVEYLEKLFSIMTKKERKKIVDNDFDELWNELWMDKTKKQYFNEYENSKKKFYNLKVGYFSKNNRFIDLDELNTTIPIIYYTPEWGFPKGRRNLHESDLDCALREFEEETGIKKDSITLYNSETYYSETFHGTNNIKYKHNYYIASLKENEKVSFKIDVNNMHQVTEISKIEWFDYETALNVMRPYNLEKKDLLSQINCILT